MLNSIFSKMLLTYLAVTLATILSISMIIGYLMEKNTYDHSEKLLQMKARRVQFLIREQQAGKLAAKDFNQQVRALEKGANLQVSIIGRRVHKFQGNMMPYGTAPGLRYWVQEVLNGKSLIVQSPFQKSDQVMLIAGQPVLKDGKVAGGLFLYTPLRNIKGTIHRINGYIALASLLIFIPAVLVIYFVSRHFTSPIVRLSGSAEKLADGDFKQRFNVRGKDEIAKLAQSFKRMASRLEQIEEGRKQFISELSHELRTPLTSIRGSLQGLLDGVVTPGEEREFLRISFQETVRLGKMVEHLLDLAAFEEHKTILQLLPCDLSALVRETALQLQGKSQDKGISLSCDCEDHIELNADADRMRQVLINLLDNAIRHTPHGGEILVSLQVCDGEKGAAGVERDSSNPRPSVPGDPGRISAEPGMQAAGGSFPAASGKKENAVREGVEWGDLQRPTALDGIKEEHLFSRTGDRIKGAYSPTQTVDREYSGLYCLLRIRDTGCGIESEKLPHIFERFYKGDASRSAQGAGLGLTIARQIVEAHGGDIGVSSVPGEGTEFFIRLPATNL